MTSPPDNLVELRDVRFGYGARPVLNELTLAVPRGKVTALMGASGGGKTTVLRLIGGQVRAQAGEVLFEGRNVGTMSAARLYAARRRMGMLFQFGALFTDLSVFENVAFPLREHTKMSQKEIRERVMDRLESLGIGHAWSKSPAELSGGMQKRVAVARSLVLETDILIYDEPTTGLDPITTCTVDELIAEAEEKFGVTSIVISHDMASVFRIADRITFMYFGEVQASGTPRELLESLNKPTMEFILASGVSRDLIDGRRND